ncbi:MAG: hypothetical protein Q4P17_02610 [Methanobacterium sp.]|nr:hypothetical protein [Methanobacterium sp.]
MANEDVTLCCFVSIAITIGLSFINPVFGIIIGLIIFFGYIIGDMFLG